MPQLQEFVNAQSLLLFKLLNWNKEEFNIFKEPLDRLSPNWFKINHSIANSSDELIFGKRRAKDGCFF